MKNVFYMGLLCLAFLFSCDVDSYINQDIEPELVVEGWIMEGKYPIVMVTTTVPVDDSMHDSDELREHILNWARVSISDGEHEVVLTGVQNNSYMPPYIFTTTEMKGETDKKYTLDVSYKDYHATAFTTIPRSVTLQSVTQEHIESADTARQLYAIFQDPQDEKNRYCLFYKIGLQSIQYNKCNLGVFDDDVLEKDVKYPIYRTTTLSDDLEAPETFIVGDTVCICLATLDAASYDFWYDYQSSAAFSGNFFTPYNNNIRSNIVGGHGYWCGYGVSEKWIIIGF